MSQTILGVDLGTFAVKVLLLERRVQDLIVLDYVDHPIDWHARTPHAEQVSEILKTIMTSHQWRVDIVSVSLPGHLLSARVLQFPFSSEKKIMMSVDFELEGHVPYPLEEIFIDFHVLQRTPDKALVCCVYLQEQKLRHYLDELAKAGLDPKYCGADLTDLAGISLQGIVPREGFYALCDIGHSKTNLVIMEGEQLRYARTIGIGGHHFTRAIQRSFNLNFEKAEALKLARGKVHIREDDSDQVSRILNKVASELATSIKQTFLGAQNVYGQISVPAIYCCGGGSKLVGFIDYLSFYLRVNVFELDVLNFITHNFDDPTEMSKTIPQVLATATHPLFSNRFPKINFRKGPYSYKADIQMITNELKSSTILFVLIILLGVGHYIFAGLHYAEKITAIDRQVVKVLEKDFADTLTTGKKGRDVRDKLKLKDILKQMQTKLSDLQAQDPAMAAGKGNIVDMMYHIAKNLPPKSQVNFEVREFTFAEDYIRMAATTNDTFNVEKIVDALRKSKTFPEIESSDAKAKPGGTYDFTLKINLKHGET